jgi:hypothetical protein
VSAWLAAAYAALVLGLAWSLAGGASWRWRIPYIVCAPPLALALWLGRADTRGWPSTASVPAHSSLVSAVVDEPDPSTGDAGRIYVWLDVGGSAPRAYSLPYSRRMHEQVQRALTAWKHGRSIAVARAVAHGDQTHGGRATSTLRFSAQSPPQLPPKQSNG